MEDKQVPYFIHYSAWTGFQKAESESMWIPICKARRTSKTQSAAACRGEDACEGLPPGKKPGAMQQRNIQAKPKKKKLTTPLELKMVVGPMSHLSLLHREGLP